ncbi:MAG: Na/Pi cotransporter family protein [Candidatus Erginobacter occultus]|nr:Na/Pi cotransporter family protein [Candidatus Erginobacter occultus]
MRKFGLAVAVLFLLALAAGSFSVFAADGPSIGASRGSGHFQMVGSEVELEALVTRDGVPASGEKVIFWIVADPAKPDKMKKESTTPATFLVAGQVIPEEGIPQVEVTSDADGLAVIPFRLGSKSGSYQVQASVDGLVGKPALFSIDSGRLPILIITLLGGLGMFIFGMNLMGDTLQLWAGAKMRSILSFFTRNRVVALVSGVIITFVLQSSSACTVLLVGFVNSGLMTLAQTIGVILGADIGTTLTVQLIAFDVGQFALAFVFVGFVCIFFTKNSSLNYLGKILIGFGLLFYGLKVMGGSMKPLAKFPPFIELLQNSTSSPITGLLVSTLLTAVIQSSAATIAIALGLAMQVGPDGKPILGLVAAIPIIYGANIGTTITAALAAIGTNRDAKRVAIAHTMFKVAGVVLFMLLIGPLSSVVLKIGGTINRQIANAHTVFNVVMALLFLPFTQFFGALIMKILPEEPEKEEAFKPKYLASDLTRTPGIALDQTKKEIARVGEIAVGLSDNTIEVFKRKDPAFVDTLKEENRKITILEAAIRPYLAEIGAQELSESNAAYAVMLLNISNEYREMGNTIAQDILPLTRNFIENNLFFSPEGWGQLQEFQASVAADVRDATKAFVENDTKLAEEVTQRKPALVRLEKKLTKEHFERLSKGMSESVETSTLHMGLMGGLRRVNSYATNIAYAVLGQV